MRDDGLRERLWLVMNHVPFDVVFSLSPGELMAFSVIVGQLHGGRFDWSRMGWQ
jgi:hypothetical protein